jgi:hypothetical protein
MSVPGKDRQRVHRTASANRLPRRLSASLVDAEDTWLWMAIVTATLRCRRIVNVHPRVHVQGNEERRARPPSYH